MVWVNINGLMVLVIVVSICLVRNMEMVNLCSLMVDIIVGTGWTESKMVTVHCIVNKDKFYRKVYGGKEYLYEIYTNCKLFLQFLYIQDHIKTNLFILFF